MSYPTSPFRPGCELQILMGLVRGLSTATHGIGALGSVHSIRLRPPLVGRGHALDETCLVQSRMCLPIRSTSGRPTDPLCMMTLRDLSSVGNNAVAQSTRGTYASKCSQSCCMIWGRWPSSVSLRRSSPRTPGPFDLSGVTVQVEGSTTYRWVVEHEQLVENPRRWQTSYGIARPSSSPCAQISLWSRARTSSSELTPVGRTSSCTGRAPVRLLRPGRACHSGPNTAPASIARSRVSSTLRSRRSS